MLTVITGTPKIKNSQKSGHEDRFDEFCFFIESYDPEFIFLPAYCIAKRFNENKRKQPNFRRFFNEKCAEMKIESGTHRAKIYRLALALAGKIK